MKQLQVPAECMTHVLYLSVLLGVKEKYSFVLLHFIWAFKQLGCLCRRRLRADLCVFIDCLVP